MAEHRNIVVVGGSVGGLQAAHNVLKNILPALKAKADAKYHVYLINPASNWYYRVASPRAAASTKRMSAEKLMFSIEDGFKQYSADDFTFIEASATGLNINARTISYKSRKSLDDEHLSYHALIVATGSRTYYQAFSQSAATQDVFDAIKTTNQKVESAKDIIVVGGGPTAIEFAAEVAEHRNGKPGWFSNAERKVNITLITATDRLLTPLRPAISKTAENKLKALGVDVVYKTRVVDAKEDRSGRTTVTLAKGETLEADLYVPAYGVEPSRRRRRLTRLCHWRCWLVLAQQHLGHPFRHACPCRKHEARPLVIQCYVTGAEAEGQGSRVQSGYKGGYGCANGDEWWCWGRHGMEVAELGDLVVEREGLYAWFEWRTDSERKGGEGDGLDKGGGCDMRLDTMRVSMSVTFCAVLLSKVPYFSISLDLFIVFHRSHNFNSCSCLFLL
jgi:hypothetical protein